MDRTITVYTTASCGYCRMLKKYLDDFNIKYIKKRVDTDHDAAQEMVTKSGQMGVPFTVINNGKGQEKAILGFNINSLQQALLS